jgi:signal transduction histidine kinase/CheY-like chemotaxis protein/HAMP domain-containing protein
MKPQDLKIGSRLTLGFGIIMILVIILGIISLSQSNLLWKNTDNLYNHPYQVGRTVRDIRISVLEIHRKMKDLAMDENLSDGQIINAIAFIDSVEMKVSEYFKIVEERYLGPKVDIEKSHQYFLEWKPLRDSLIRSRIDRGRDEAFSYYQRKNRFYVDNMFVEVNKMIEFASAKGDSFYEQARNEKDRLLLFLVVVLVSIFMITTLIIYYLVNGITTPLNSLTKVAGLYSDGNYNVRSDYNAGNEIGALASTFNKMAASVQNDIIIKENVSWISNLMMNENNLKSFCKSLLNALLIKTDSQIAAIYLLNPVTSLYEHYESIGLLTEGTRTFSAVAMEGEFGPVLAEKKISRITGIPDDTIFIFHAVAGSFKPREIISIPVIDNTEVVAVISLASLKSYSELSVIMLNEIWMTISARFIGVLGFQKISDFSATVDLQNRELQQKSKEMLMQADELKEYNIELELQKKQLDEANKLKSSFLSNMSHELRTPLNSVIALSGVLLRRLKDKVPDDEFSYISIIEKNGKNLLLLINDILDLSRIESGKEELTFSRFSVSELVTDILHSLETVSDEKGLSITNSIPGDLPVIISDETKCHHIIQNLISNAIKFTEKGSVEISAIVKDENIHISVADTGIGIPEDFIPHVFDEFRQADDKTSRKFGGTGLGLAIVRKYCLMLNGTVEVKSKHGSGSTFTVVIPFRPKDHNISHDDSGIQQKTWLSSGSNTAGIMSGAGRTILLVEDSEPQIIQLSEILNEEGIIFRVARDGKEALESVKKTVPDAMILDLQMPGTDGFEVLKEVRNLKDTRSIPVLILTAKHITKAELSFLKNNNVYQLIRKGSVNRDALLSAIRNLLAHSSENVSGQSAKVKSDHIEGRKASILVIEDNPDNLITLKAILEKNYIINSAIDGVEGLKKALIEKPDLILLDISLPGIDGFKVLDEIKKNDKLSGIPVVALTARAMKGDREQLMEYGFDGYIAKPVDFDTFEKTIRDYINFHFPTPLNGAGTESE